MKVTLDANGPGFCLNQTDVETLRKNQFIEYFPDERSPKKIFARVRLVKRDPNEEILENGFKISVDSDCEAGVLLSRCPERKCPHDAKLLFYSLLISEERLEYVTSRTNAEEVFFPRCKYDRFWIRFDNF